MRVGLVIYGSIETTSGGYLYDRMLVSKLRQRGDTVEILSMPRRSYGGSLLENFRFRSPPNLDVLLQDELNHPSLFIANRRRHAAPVVSIVHHLRSSERRPSWQHALFRAVERHYLRSVDGFVFNSHTTRRVVAQLTSNQKPNIVATPGGNRLGQMAESVVGQRSNESGPLRLIFVGAVTRAKGLAVLLDALAALPRQDFVLRIVGPSAAGDGYAEAARRKAAELGLSAEFCGELNEAGLAAEFRTAQALVLPSYYEGFGISILEAMAHGLAVVATRAGAIPELVTEAESGFLVEPGDSESLAERLRILHKDRSLLQRIGLGALRRFRKYPGWDDTTERIRDFLLSISQAKSLGNGHR